MASERERDAEMDRLLRGVLADAPAAPADACPPAGDLAAYVERALPAAEREAMEAHLASCARCQDALALLAGMPDAAAAPSPAAAWWRAGWKRWLVPATAVATGLILYVALKPEPPLRTAPPSSGQVALSVPAQAPVPEAPAATGAGGEAMAGAAAPRKERALEAEPRPKGATPPVEAQTNKAAAAGERRLAEAPGRTATDAMAKQEAPPAQVTALADARPAAPPAAPAPAAAEAEAKKPAEQAEAAPGVAAGAVGGVARGAEGVAFRQQASKLSTEAPARPESRGPLVVASPGNPPQALWRLEDGGRIFGSTDGGKTWRLQRPGGGELLAASSPSRTVCWAVGANGLVLRTTDGATWEARPFPEPADLVAVAAAGALQATVTTRDGRRFTTEDGGGTWTTDK